MFSKAKITVGIFLVRNRNKYFQFGFYTLKLFRNMAQPSVVHYFNTRKRPAIDEFKVDAVRKVLILEQDNCLEINRSEKANLISKANVLNESKRTTTKEEVSNGPSKVANLVNQNMSKKVIRISKGKKSKGYQNIQNFLDNVKKSERCVTPPNQPVKKSSNELDEIKRKLCRSSKLTELKASINKFKESAEHLKAAEKRTEEASQSPKLKSFKSIEFEVSVSSQKAQSPEKAYLSPKKESSVRRNLLSALSPTKTFLASAPESPCKEVLNNTSKQGLKLPFKYRTLAEIFRAIDTVSQILYNRKETITFRKLKPAVEEMLKRTLSLKHIAQIKCIYPHAYDYSQEKSKQFGTEMRQEQWNLVLIPNTGHAENMTAEVLLNRRRKLYETLTDRVKNYHNEFLLSLIPPMTIPKDKITHWHPEFDIEKVPDIELSDIPEAPIGEKVTTAKEVLEKARQMFNCNPRMEEALAKLKAAREKTPPSQLEESSQPTSILKGIPKALLEKVRQRQAVKALVSMTRSLDKDKEVQMYARLPEIARVTRSLFVTEKKSVLPLDIVIEKLGNSYRCFLSKTEIEDHLMTISKEIPGWLIFHQLRSSIFLKLAKNADLSIILSKLEKLAKEKSKF